MSRKKRKINYNIHTKKLLTTTTASRVTKKITHINALVYILYT